MSSSFMKMTSPSFEHDGSLPSLYTCDGTGINPSLTITDVPVAAQSIVLIVDDPDAPGETFDHWVVWNIPPSMETIGEGEIPSGVVGKNSGGGNAYYPPCPPSGEHRYTFKLYALDTTLALSPGSTKADVERAIENHILDSAELIGRYSRQ